MNNKENKIHKAILSNATTNMIISKEGKQKN